MVTVKQKQLCQFPISALFRFTPCSLSSLRGSGRDTGAHAHAHTCAHTCARTHTHVLSPFTHPRLHFSVARECFWFSKKESQSREATRAQTTIKCYNMLSSWSSYKAGKGKGSSIMPIFIFNYSLPTCGFIAVRSQGRTRNQPTIPRSHPPACDTCGCVCTCTDILKQLSEGSIELTPEASLGFVVFFRTCLFVHYFLATRR